MADAAGDFVEPIYAEVAPCATVLCAKITGLASAAARLRPSTLLSFLHGVHTEFDALAAELKLLKLHGFGNEYVAVGGMVDDPEPGAASRVMRLARAMQGACARFSLPSPGAGDAASDVLKLQVGLATGEVAGGVIGLKLPTFGVFGSVQFTAAQLADAASPGQVLMCKDTWDLLEPVDQADWAPLVGSRGGPYGWPAASLPPLSPRQLGASGPPPASSARTGLTPDIPEPVKGAGKSSGGGREAAGSAGASGSAGGQDAGAGGGAEGTGGWRRAGGQGLLVALLLSSLCVSVCASWAWEDVGPPSNVANKLLPLVGVAAWPFVVMLGCYALGRCSGPAVTAGHGGGAVEAGAAAAGAKPASKLA